MELLTGQRGASQAALVGLLSLPLLRVCAQRSLRASGDHDKISCTAVRTLGYCVQALLFHWLPLPAESPLWDAPNAFITPHTAGETRRYEDNVLDILMENLARQWRGDAALLNQVV